MLARMRFARRGAALAVLALVAGSCGETPAEPVSVVPEAGLAGFEASLDSVRVALRIPGMAAAVAQGGDIVWSRGCGFADVEHGVPATDTTSFYVASVTKSVAAIVLMQLVEVFSASLPPSNVATVLACLDILEQEPELVERVNKVGERMRTEVRAMGYNIGDTQTPIIPIIIGDMMKTMEAWKVFFRAGSYTTVALPAAAPSHPPLRLSGLGGGSPHELLRGGI